MPTIIRFDGKSEDYVSFGVYKGPLIYVHSFEDGIVEVQPWSGAIIDDFAKIIEGCFAPGSNFEREILKTFKAKSGTKVKGIKVVFNDIHVCTATREEHNAKYIVGKYFGIIDSM
ncbi:MAG: hypothetical protein IJ272_10330 [Clostridia bacterium]|nr:hypothetical protein [Clostridia bacterium]